MQVDHIDPRYRGGSNDPENLQTLCGECNNKKRTDTITFLDHRTRLTEPPGALPDIEVPAYLSDEDLKGWIEFAQRTVNFFYQCGAVKTIMITEIRPCCYQWEVRLHYGNDPKWLKPHLSELLKRICSSREFSKCGSPYKPSKITAVSENRRGEIENQTQSVEAVQWIKDRLTGKVETSEDMNFVGSIASNKYHLPSCGWAKKIPLEDLVSFPNIEAAKDLGYLPCRVCNPNRRRKRQ